MVFSNNMEYDANSVQPIEGALYATASYQKPVFYYFREEERFDLSKPLTAEDDQLENFVLIDTNNPVIKNAGKFP